MHKRLTYAILKCWLLLTIYNTNANSFIDDSLAKEAQYEIQMKTEVFFQLPILI